MSADLSTARWIKSSYSGNNGTCVELAWIKSSYSTNNGECVELAVMADRVAARDSKNPVSPVLTFPAKSFSSFLRTM
jgi:hypothetical protein